MYVCNDVERVERSLNGLYILMLLMLKGSKDYVMLKQGTNTFLLITFLIFNRFLILKKVLESLDLDLSNHTIQCYECMYLYCVHKPQTPFLTLLT